MPECRSRAGDPFLTAYGRQLYRSWLWHETARAYGPNAVPPGSALIQASRQLPPSFLEPSSESDNEKGIAMLQGHGPLKPRSIASDSTPRRHMRINQIHSRVLKGFFTVTLLRPTKLFWTNRQTNAASKNKIVPTGG